MRKYEQLAKDIVENVGGRENINSVTHCVTRLRFDLKDISKANDDILKNMNGVVTVMKSAGQYQVVIGNQVGEVFEEVCNVTGFGEQKNSENKSEKKSFKENAMDMLSQIFMPSVNVLAASGLIKGLLAILSFTGILPATEGLYILLNAVGDAFFYFFPVFLGYNSAKKFGLNIYLGMVIGAALCYPAINGVDLSIMGMDMNVTYTSTVLPVILIVALAAPLEKFFNRVIPDMIKSFITPVLVMLIAVPVGYVIVGPVANWLASLISTGLFTLYSLNPYIAGFVIAALYQIMIVFGIHAVLVVTFVMNVISGNPDPIAALLGGVSFVQTGVVFAIWLKTKNENLKKVALPAWISGLFGVTEPAIYGVTLPRMKYFVVSCLLSGVSGVISVLFGLRAFSIGAMGFFSVAGFIDPENPTQTLLLGILLFVIALVLGFCVTYLLYKDSDYGDDVTETKDDKRTDKKENATISQGQRENIMSPMDGTVVNLCEVEDEAFSGGLLGKGVAIMPASGKVYAPFSGTVQTMFSTGHAVGVLSDTGCEVLIHLGLNTVQLQGKHFTAHVKQGNRVKQGDLLISFELEELKEEGYSMVSPVIIANTEDYQDVVAIAEGEIHSGEPLITVLS